MIATIYSPKGGVGKTTLITNLAVIAAKTKYVLAIDLDANGDTTSTLGHTPAPRAYQWLSDDPTYPLNIDPRTPVVFPTAGEINLKLIPGNAAIERLTPLLMTDPQFTIQTLATRIRSMSDAYDLTLIDTAYGAGTAARNAAIAAADVVVMPLEPSAYDLDKIEMIRRQASRLIIVPNKVDRTRAQADIMEWLETNYANNLLHTEAGIIKIPYLAKAAKEAAIARMPIAVHNPTSPIAIAIEEMEKAL